MENSVVVITVSDVIEVLNRHDPNEEVRYKMPVEWPYRPGPVERKEGDTNVYLDEVFKQASDLEKE